MKANIIHKFLYFFHYSNIRQFNLQPSTFQSVYSYIDHYVFHSFYKLITKNEHIYKL
jgi:hypothetical protein